MNSHMLLGKGKVQQLWIVFSAPIGLVELNTYLGEILISTCYKLFPFKRSMIYFGHYVLQLF